MLLIYFSVLTFLALALQAKIRKQETTSPNIILFVADDLGWNDVGYNGATDCYTPNIDTLMANSAALFHHYTYAMCTPTRAALMTGRQPYRYGFQHDSAMSLVIENGLAINEVLIAEVLQDNGYNTYMTGKWDLGNYMWDYTPNYRGFGEFVGFYGSTLDYYSYKATESDEIGIDFRYNTAAFNASQSYNKSFDVYSSTITNWIEEALTYNNKPFFWYVAHQSPHIPVELFTEYIKIVSGERTYDSPVRKNYCAMVYGLDLALGSMVTQLQENDLWDNTYLIFFSDNGAAAGIGSAYPFRGVKGTLFEGGIRSPTFVSGGKLPSSMQGTTLTETAHVTDWFSTICSFASVNCSSYNLDGTDLSNYITQGVKPSREYLLLNVDSVGCDEVYGTDVTVCGGIRYKEWKLVVGNQINGNSSSYYWAINYINNSMIDYSKSSVKCNGEEPDFNVESNCALLNAVCLFNVVDDPCEYYDLSSEYPELAQKLLTKLYEYYESQEEPVQIFSTYNASGADPANFNGYWTPWRKSSEDGTNYQTNNNDVDIASAAQYSSRRPNKFTSMLVSGLI